MGACIGKPAQQGNGSTGSLKTTTQRDETKQTTKLNDSQEKQQQTTAESEKSAQKKVFLLQFGAFNPPHFMHLRLMGEYFICDFS